VDVVEGTGAAGSTAAGMGSALGQGGESTTGNGAIESSNQQGQDQDPRMDEMVIREQNGDCQESPAGDSSPLNHLPSMLRKDLPPTQ